MNLTFNKYKAGGYLSFEQPEKLKSLNIKQLQKLYARSERMEKANYFLNKKAWKAEDGELPSCKLCSEIKAEINRRLADFEDKNATVYMKEYKAVFR